MKKFYFWLIISFLAAQIACRSEIVSQETNSFTEPANLAIDAQTSVKIPENLAQSIKAVEPFFQLMGKPQPNEWLATFKEDGQTFEQYINENPTLPTAERKTLYIQPLGRFDKTQQKTIKLAAEYMQAFFNLPVKLLPERTFAESMPYKSYRTNKYTKRKQIRTGYVLDEILQPSLPADAAALIGFTGEDLYPNESFNYVFGQASFEKRVGIWSLSRLAENARGDEFLTRTLKIAVHETGHMFSIAHCTKYECVMSGTNHLNETDRRPIDACPECMAKICWMTGYKPEIRYGNLAQFCKKSGLKTEADKFVQKKLAVGKR